MASQKKKKPRKKVEVRLSNVVKPKEMTLEQWQAGLRRQAVAREKFHVRELDRELCPGEYEVYNIIKKNAYTVHYHGDDHPLTGCTCMDYRTSHLGTCKHIEAVKDWIMEESDHPGAAYLPDPEVTFLYVDYHSAPKCRILWGSEDREQLSSIFEGRFDEGGNLLPGMLLTILPLIREAEGASTFFRCSEDVRLMADRAWDDFVRRDRMTRFFGREDWWKDIFLPGVKPFPYQEEGIKFAALKGRCIIADEMGLGKTIQAIGTAAIFLREGLVGSVLVVCPTSLKYQWKREIKKFTGIESLVVEGNHLVRKKLYAGPEQFKIVSYNSLCNDIKIMGGFDADMVIMDEVQRLKNWDTQIARAARKIHTDYSVILSGTPLENKLQELYSIVELVDQYILGPYHEFRRDHIITTDSGKIIGYQNLNAVGKTLEGILLRRRKAEVALQLPSRMDQNIFVPMTSEQLGIHEEAKSSVGKIVYKWRKTHFLSETDRRRLMVFLGMMRMACDSTYVIDQNLAARKDTKVDEVMNILESIIESGDAKVVVFSGWERMTRLIAMQLEERGIGYSNLNGMVPSIKRKALIDTFNDDPDVRVFLSTDAGSTGLNLQVASYVINLDLPWNPAVLEQRVGRIYRIGQQRSIQVINLVAQGTIEERMLRILRFKTGLFDGVLNGGEDSVFMDDNKLEKMMGELGFMEETVEEEPIGELDSMEEAVAVDADDMEKRQDENGPGGDVKDGNEKNPPKGDTAQAPSGDASPDGVILEGKQSDEDELDDQDYYYDLYPTGGQQDGEAGDSAEEKPETGGQAGTAPGAEETPVGEIAGPVQTAAQEAAGVDGDSASSSQPTGVGGEAASHAGGSASAPVGTPTDAENLIRSGVSFFGSLLQTLREPQSTKTLVDSLVKKDEKTGQTSINIPVSSKETVLEVATLLGKLLSGLK